LTNSLLYGSYLETVEKFLLKDEVYSVWSLLVCYMLLLEFGRTSGPVWVGPKNLTPTKVRTPDRPAKSWSLSRTP